MGSATAVIDGTGVVAVYRIGEALELIGKGQWNGERIIGCGVEVPLEVISPLERAIAAAKTRQRVRG